MKFEEAKLYVENGDLKEENENLHSVKNELLTRCHKLREQLKEANEVIKFYSDAHQLMEEEKQMTAEKYHLIMGLKAIDYLERWGVK